jgi:hypothetical protein
LANERHSYVELYPSDWMAGTAYMPPLAEWLYLQVCLYNWDKREPVPPAQAALRFSRSPSWAADLEMLIDAGKVIKTAGGGLFVERAMVAANKASEELMIGKLEGIYREHGHDPTAVLEQSIYHGWSGVFPLKEQDNGRSGGQGTGPGGTAQGSSDGFSRAVDRRLEQG